MIDAFDGIVEEYQLGQNIRSTYNTLIGQRYVPSKVSSIPESVV
uniref:Uncharacterized protein n=1 Tax=Parascaris equorum TaxID=6256 RepID=A0A914S151_PAREQ